MGYNFHKRSADGFYIRLTDASTVRAAAAIEGLTHLMPMPDGGNAGGIIGPEHRDCLARVFLEQSELLKELAEYFDDADELRWDH